jgi:hypothetical protein
MRIGPIFVNRRIGNLIAHTTWSSRPPAPQTSSSVGDKDRRNQLAADERGIPRPGWAACNGKHDVFQQAYAKSA